MVTSTLTKKRVLLTDTCKGFFVISHIPTNIYNFNNGESSDERQIFKLNSFKWLCYAYNELFGDNFICHYSIQNSLIEKRVFVPSALLFLA